MAWYICVRLTSGKIFTIFTILPNILPQGTMDLNVFKLLKAFRSQYEEDLSVSVNVMEFLCPRLEK